MNAGRFVALIAVASVASIAIVCGFWFAIASKTKPRHHIYYCVHPDTSHSFPCKYRRNDPVDV